MDRQNYIKPQDFKAVGIVAASCSYDKLNQAILEALEFDMVHTFTYNLMHVILANWDAQSTGDATKDTVLKLLIDGGTYNVPNCENKIANFAGIKKIWLYFAYSKYVLINQFDDSAVGLKYKESQFSTGVGYKELNNLENKYKNMAKDAVYHTKEFLCHVKHIITEYDSCNCKLACGCSVSCSCQNGKPHKLTGFRIKTVEK